MPEDAVDPRFDPRFQRGYDPSRHGTAPPTPPRREPPPVVTAPAAPTAPDPAPVESAVPAAAPVATEPDDPALEPPSGEHLDAAPRRNAPLLALLIVGVVSVLASLALVLAQLDGRNAMSPFRPDVGEVMWEYVRGTLPQPLFAGGIAAIVAWVVTTTLLGRDR